MADLPDQPPSDAVLLGEYLQTNSDTAFARLVARHSDAIHRLAVRHTGNHAAAEDVTQATFLVLARRAKSARRASRRGDVLPWLAKVCKYVAANWRRSESRRRKHEGQAVPSDPTDLTRPIELAEMVTVALRDLRRRDRRLVELRHLDGLPWTEVADRVRTTPDAARKATGVALDKLRNALSRRGITVAPSALLSTLAYLATPTKAAAPTAAAFTLATGAITMMKLK
ncbi:MAG: sigma-70 family RNA polymerase sigma factor, partial [Planctomycetota bacterium]